MIEAARSDALRSADGILIEMSVDDHDLAADGDPERIHQVVANLLENAVRHSPRGGSVQVRACHTADTVTIEVLDDGPGIAAADADRVFERFYRTDEARSTHSGGSGLGLPIARWVVDLHGGRIWAEQREPHGCRMVVELPDGNRSKATGT